ncbi:MAG: sigma-54 dependent transcriptional regulator [Desulfobulbaceae bacterium]|nr:sigma-54 dependent transcriptional regulator [Desulfobulbaceae bacterium]
MNTILIVDDDLALCRSLELQLDVRKYQIRSAYNAADAKCLACSFKPDLILLDLNLPDQSGLEILPFLVANDYTVVIMTGEPKNSLVVEAMLLGAYDYLKKPLDLDDVADLLKKTMRFIRRKKQQEADPESSGRYESGWEIIGEHPSIIEVLKQIGLLARNRVTVLIQGESGTGKELAARILHLAGTPGQPFVAVNCSAVVPTLLESEFFGHERGAFTGADRLKIGKIEHAAGGTVFLDEIGDMTLDLQSKFLRVLQEEEFVRVGGLEPIPFAARIVAATNKDLQLMIEQEKFREDLFYRLSVATLNLPSLRERMSDVPILVDHLLAKISRKLGVSPIGVDHEAMEWLMRYDWPGNIRELENVLMSACAMAKGQILAADDLKILTSREAREVGNGHSVTLAQAEKLQIEKSLEANNWNITRTAQILDISQTTLRKKIADYALRREKFDASANRK